MYRKLLVFISTACLLVACSPEQRRFRLKPPLWQDPDRNHVPHQPSEQFIGTWADALDKTFLRPLAELFWLPTPGEAVNVNSLDEVPNSSWFTNRIGLFPMTPAEVARGSCSLPPPDPTKPWLVTRAKTAGTNPGFFVKMPDGKTYLLKFDGSSRPTRATAADVIGSKIYHAVGYNAPCNQVVYFKPEILKMAKDAVALNEIGEKRPLTPEDVNTVLAAAYRRKDGQVRAAASMFLEGKPLGPFSNEGVRSDDPNDIVPHEHRREIRANRLLAAWLNHFDSRSANSLDMFVKENGRSFVKHYMIDFGDSFGGGSGDLRLGRLVGHSHYFDLEHVFLDFVTLGLLPRPWHRASINEEAPIFGLYHWKNFEPSAWRGIYSNPAFSRMTYRDALWMVRILVRFTDEHIRTLVGTGRFENPRYDEFLTRALIERRDAMALEYLGRYVPLDRIKLIRRTPGDLAQSLCFEDLGILHAGIEPAHVLYKIQMMAGENLDQQLAWLQFQPDPDHPHRSCVLLPLGDRRPHQMAPANAPDDHPLRYGVLQIQVFKKPSLPPNQINVHLVDLGPKRGFMIVGLERPPGLVQDLER